MKVFVIAKPNSNSNSIKEIMKNHFAVSVTELPVKGRANNAIIGVLAEHFKISPSTIRLVSGFSSKNKVFEWRD